MLGNCFRPLCALLLVLLVLHKVHIGNALFFRPNLLTDFRASVSSGNNPPSQPLHTVYPKTFSTFHIVNPPVTQEISSFKPEAINYNAQELNRQVSNLLNSNTQNQAQQPPLTFFQTNSLVGTIPIIPERSRSNNTLNRNLKNINTQSRSSVDGVKRKTQNRSNGPTKAISNTANTRPRNSSSPKSTKSPKKTKSVNPVQRGRSPRVKSPKANPNLASSRKVLKNTNRGRTSQNVRSSSRPSQRPESEDDEETDNDMDYDSGNDADNEDSPQEDEPEDSGRDLDEDGENDENPQEEDPEEDDPQEENPEEADPEEEDREEADPQEDDPQEDEDNFGRLRKPSLTNSDAERIQSAIQVLLRTANNLQQQQFTGRKRITSQRQ